ncbi:hypothetical protein QN277_001913 [Acacia crassicarpa]|nr:hypothetical protein QN277_001913 [Acacia crassicarpa]
MSCSTIFSLPQELLLEILALVASSSFFDLFHAKLSCRAFNGIAESNKDYIYKQVSLEKLPVDSWRDNSRVEQVFSFLRNCTENENPQALYRQGLVEYFNHENLEKGLRYIKASSDSCHEGASYIFGVIMACDSTKCYQEVGMGVLKNIMKKKKKNSSLRECREKFKDIMKHQWRNKKLKPNPNSCHMKDEHKMTMTKMKNSGWLSETERAEEIECEECRCHWEVTYISNWLHGKSMYTF